MQALPFVVQLAFDSPVVQPLLVRLGFGADPRLDGPSHKTDERDKNEYLDWNVPSARGTLRRSVVPHNAGGCESDRSFEITFDFE